MTPAIIPADANESAPNPLLRPTDQDESWSAITLPGTTPISFEVYVHQGPLGWGYTVIGSIVISGILWKRFAGTGPHSTSADWQAVT